MFHEAIPILEELEHFSHRDYYPALQEEVALKFIAATEKGDLNKLFSFESLLILGTAYTFELGINPLS